MDPMAEPSQSAPEFKVAIIAVILTFFAFPPFFSMILFTAEVPWQGHAIMLVPNAVVIGLYLLTRGWLAKQESFLFVGPAIWRRAPAVCYAMGLVTGLLVATGAVEAVALLFLE